MIIERIVYGCDIARDPAENRRNHQAMVDTLNGLVADDGWPGVKVEAFYTQNSSAFIEIVPGVSALTLDYLRGLKERGELRPPVVMEPEGQGRLL